jgi:transposase
MTSMTHIAAEVTGGVDTHGLTHHAAVIDSIGRHPADQEFPATVSGYRDLLIWMRSHGTLIAVGVEGAGAYGAELARVLTATAVASGRATGSPKSRTGTVEAVRVLRVARRSAVKARTQAMNQIRGVLVSAPAVLREQVADLSRAALIRALARLRPGGDLSSPLAATKASLRRLARRHQAMDEEIAELDCEIAPLVERAAPELLALFGVGVETAGQLLASAGDNPERMRSEGAFAHLTGVAPIPASSGRTHRHRLNRGGDRAANSALHTIVLVRMRYDERTRAYVERRTAEGLSKKEIMRCLKRFVAREVYRVLTSKPQQKTAQTDLAQAAWGPSTNKWCVSCQLGIDVMDMRYPARSAGSTRRTVRGSLVCPCRSRSGLMVMRTVRMWASLTWSRWAIRDLEMPRWSRTAAHVWCSKVSLGRRRGTDHPSASVNSRSSAVSWSRMARDRPVRAGWVTTAVSNASPAQARPLGSGGSVGGWGVSGWGGSV